MYSFNKKTNTVKNQLTDSCGEVADTAKIYKTAGFGIVVFGIENYGQNSSNESAIIESHDLGVRAVIVKSFTRIHETNLKKQGMLALTFVNPSDYDLIQEEDRVSILGLADFTPGQPLMLEALHSDGSKDVFPVHHTYNEAQIQWFKAGSALNEIRANQ
tara:strand:+ start:120 stop:596 length:477 start_codon:yes stop_codon:yes gene_type:complete